MHNLILLPLKVEIADLHICLISLIIKYIENRSEKRVKSLEKKIEKCTNEEKRVK